MTGVAYGKSRDVFHRTAFTLVEAVVSVLIVSTMLVAALSTVVGCSALTSSDANNSITYHGLRPRHVADTLALNVYSNTGFRDNQPLAQCNIYLSLAAANIKSLLPSGKHPCIFSLHR